MSSFKLVVVRSDGLSHSSEFSGWHAETAMCRYFREAEGDKRTLTAHVFSGQEGQWQPYKHHHAGA